MGKEARDAETGRFETMAEAEADPDTSVVETMPPRAPESPEAFEKALRELIIAAGQKGYVVTTSCSPEDLYDPDANDADISVRAM